MAISVVSVMINPQTMTINRSGLRLFFFVAEFLSAVLFYAGLMTSKLHGKTHDVTSDLKSPASAVERGIIASDGLPRSSEGSSLRSEGMFTTVISGHACRGSEGHLNPVRRQHYVKQVTTEQSRCV